MTVETHTERPTPEAADLMYETAGPFWRGAPSPATMDTWGPQQGQTTRHEPTRATMPEQVVFSRTNPTEQLGRDYLGIIATAAKYAITPIPRGLIRNVTSIFIAEMAGNTRT
jgi:hypothetical protein